LNFLMVFLSKSITILFLILKISERCRTTVTPYRYHKMFPGNDSRVPTASPSVYSSGGSGIRNAITYNGGPLLVRNIKIHNIFIGSFNVNTSTIRVLDYFANNIASTDWYNVMKLYYQIVDNVKTSVVGTANLVNANVRHRILPYNGTLNEDAVHTLISYYIELNNLSPDEDAIYAVIFRGDYTYVAPDSSTWLGAWCGYHYYYEHDSGALLKFFVAGDPSTAPGGGIGCHFAGDVPPNNSPGGDAIATIFAHELIEIVTDWKSDAWFFSNGYENADECAWQFDNILPATGTLAANSANILVGKKYFLIQNTFVPPNLGCAMSAGAFTSSPSRKPSLRPTSIPTVATTKPSSKPITPASINSASKPSFLPTSFPSIFSTILPTKKASFNPTTTMKPTTRNPTCCPTYNPTTNNPTRSPSCSPSCCPSCSISRSPTYYPTPTNKPTTKPSYLMPSSIPSNIPKKTVNPTQNPTTVGKSTNTPTLIPSVKAKITFLPSPKPVKLTATNSPTSNKGKVIK